MEHDHDVEDDDLEPMRGAASKLGHSRPKAERLVALSTILRQGRPITLSELQERYGMYRDANEASARRKFERDKAELRELGVDIATTKYEETPAYWITRDSVKQTVIAWTEEELDALAVLTATIGDDATGAALGKLTASSGAFAVDESTARIAMDVTVPDTIVDAIAQRRQLLIDYRNAEGVVSSRTIEPWDLRARHGFLYVVGYDHETDGERTFRIDRVQGSPTLGETAEHVRPDGPRRPLYPDDRVDLEVLVPVDAREDAVVAGGRVDGEDDGWLDVRFEQHRSEPVIALALRAGAVIVAPDDVAAEQRRRAERLQRVHSGPATRVDRPPVRPNRPSTLSSVRLERLLALPAWLGSRHGVTRAEIAAAFAITPEEVDTELDLLDMIDIPGIGSVGEVEERKGQILYHRRVPEPTAGLTPTDALRLLLLVETGMAVLSEQDASALPSIRERLREALPADARIEFAGLEHVELDLVKQAIAGRQVIQFQYKGRKDTTWRDREVAPSRLLVANGALYLAGIDVQSGEERNFRLDRMTNVELAGEIPAVPAEAPTPTYVPVGDEVEVTLLLSTKAAWVAVSVRPDAAASADDGSAVVVVRTDAADWLISHVMAAGGEAEVIAPGDLRDRVRQLAEELLARIDTRSG